LGTRIIETLDIARKANDPEKPDDQIMAAFLHTRFGRMLAGALPAQDVQRHHRIAIDVLERLEQITPPRFAIPFFPYESPQELLAECRVNLASSLRPSEEGKANLELAIEFLDDQTGTAVEEIEWRTNLLAQAERDLGAVLNQLGQPDDARRHLRRSIAVFEDLLAEWPAVVEYQLNLAIAKSTLDSITNAPSHVTK
jgi:tetratricopeptide (TPR) repeat protein